MGLTTFLGGGESAVLHGTADIGRTLEGEEVCEKAYTSEKESAMSTPVPGDSAAAPDSPPPPSADQGGWACSGACIPRRVAAAVLAAEAPCDVSLRVAGGPV